MRPQGEKTGIAKAARHSRLRSKKKSFGGEKGIVAGGRVTRGQSKMRHFAARRTLLRKGGSSARPKKLSGEKENIVYWSARHAEDIILRASTVASRSSEWNEPPVMVVRSYVLPEKGEGETSSEGEGEKGIPNMMAERKISALRGYRTSGWRRKASLETAKEERYA